jgi:pimeloyl-ACP methyl ester carboxylesterase
VSTDPVERELANDRHLVFLVHGISTLMAWRRDLRSELGKIQGVETHIFFYGFFSLLRFYLAWTRDRVVRKFALEYFEQVATRRPARVSIIAHSFGTYVVCRALQKYPLQVDTLILCGSVLPEQERFTGWFLHGKERVGRVVNDIAERDIWVLLGKLVIPGVGAGGLVGLSIPGGRLFERVFSGYRHGSFFNVRHYRAHWIPMLRGEDPDGPADHRQIPRLYVRLISWARPIKVVANLLLIMLVMYAGAWGWGFGSRVHLTWTASPFEVVGPVASQQRPSGCVEHGHVVVKVVKLSLLAPAAGAEETFQIRVLIGLRSGSRWSIQDVESSGAGQVRMDSPDRDYWVYGVRSTERVSFLICGVTDTPTGGAFLDDVRVRFSDTTRL